MRDICAKHPRRAGCRRAAAWRLCLMLIPILILGAVVTTGFVPSAARAASRDLCSEFGGGSLTGDPDDGEHVTGPGLPPVSSTNTGDATALTYSRYAISVPQSSDVTLLPSRRFALMRALIRSARPLAWLALSARQPWACDPLWLMTATMADPAVAPRPAPYPAPTAGPIMVSGRTR